MSEKTRNLMEQFMRLQWLIGRYFHQNHRARGPMSSPYNGQGRVLKVLNLNSPISQKDLAEILGVRPQSLGELLVKLENSGYIERKQSENDRRVTLVSLTSLGKETIEENKSTDISDDIFGCLSEEELNQFSSYLDKMIENLSKYTQGESSEQFDAHFQRGFHQRHRYF